MEQSPISGMKTTRIPGLRDGMGVGREETDGEQRDGQRQTDREGETERDKDRDMVID